MEYFELEELVLCAAGKTEEEIDVEFLCEEVFGVTLEQFENVAKALLKLTPLVKSEITDKLYYSFVVQEKGYLRAIVKEEHDES